jgi:hypothetical protein
VERLAVRQDVLDASVTAIAGYFAEQAWQPPIAGLPRLRQIQRCQLDASLRWCAARLDLPTPHWLGALER